MISVRIYPSKEIARLRKLTRNLLAATLLSVCAAGARPGLMAGPQAAAQPDRSWIASSNAYTNQLLNVLKKHSPEDASSQGLADYDEKISRPTKQDEDAAIAETKAVQAKLTRALALESDKNVQQDLTILLHSIQLTLKRHDFANAHEVPYENASSDVFQGLRVLLDDQVAPDRRKAALVRLRRYAGLEPGYTPFTEILKQRAQEQIAKPNMIFPAKLEIDTELSRNQNYLDGIPALFKQYGLTGWEEPFAKLKTELTGYDSWVKSDILPKARTDFRLPPEEYALNLESFGIDIPIAQLAQMAHHEFKVYQAEMQVIAAQIAHQRGWQDTDYRSVCRRLKQDQLTGECHSSVLQETRGRNRSDHRQAKPRHSSGPPRANPDRHARGELAAARAAHGASSSAEQYGRARRIRAPAEYAAHGGDRETGEDRRLHLRRRLVDHHRA